MKKIFALGFFDGVHLGHQALLAECARLAEIHTCETAAITFEAHPQALFTDNPPKLINTAQDRNRLLLQYGIVHVHTFPVTKEMMATEAVQKLMKVLNDPAFRKEIAHFSGNDYRDLGKIIGEV